MTPERPDSEERRVVDLEKRRPKPMSDQPPADGAPPEDGEESESDRRTANIVLALFVVVVIGIGIWLVNALLEQRRIDDCMAQGRRNCGAVTSPPRE